MRQGGSSEERTKIMADREQLLRDPARLAAEVRWLLHLATKEASERGSAQRRYDACACAILLSSAFGHS